jgi:subtilisin family serine protease
MGLQVISRDPDKTVVVFSSDEELREFRRYMREFSGLAEGRVHEYKFMGSIRELERLRPEDRKGRLLQAEPLGDGEIAPLDIEIMHPGDRQQCQQYIRELTNLAEQYNGRLSDFYTGDSLCLARCQANPELLNELLSTDYVMEVDRRPRPTFDQALLYETRLQDIGDVPDVPEDAPGVLVMDSGVMSNHPLIRPALGEAEVFPGSMDTRITGGAEDGDTTDGGHGTKVCGIAIYGDVATCITTGVFQPKVRLFSARVLDDNCEYDEETLVEKQFELAIHYFITNYPECKVINLSLGDEKLFYRDGQKQFRLAAKIDEMALKYQDRNIVFTVSAGNYRYQPPNPEDLKTDYPDYLLNHAEARIIDPATSAIALTVGSLSTGNVPFYAQRFPGDVCEAIAGTAKFPSPFTRTGFGPDGIIKPEIVDYGGDYVFSKRNPDNRSDPGLGVPTLSRDFAPPESRLFTTGVGTSYSAPAVANLAARLFDRFPGATSNLIRALIVDSARIPDLRPDILNSDPSDESVLRVYGYGQPNFEAAAFSDQSEVLLVAEDKLSIDKFHLYEIPPLPPEFKKLNGDRYLSVTLAFDPPTRHTRGEYCGVRMGFEVFRNVAADEVSAAYLDWKRLEGRDDLQELERKLKDFLSSQRVKLKPGSIIRSKGTVQKGTTKIGDRWTYEGDPMIISVATLKRSWLPEIYDAQRYALVVSIRHSSPDIRLYDRIRQHTRVAERIRIRV